jgi:hypothetical protein
VNRYDDYALFFLLIFSFSLPSFLGAEIGSIPSGQSLWWITKRVGEATVPIESCVDELSLGGETVLSAADVSLTGTITILESGNYCVFEDLTADIAITGTGVALDLNGHCITGVIQVQSADVGFSITDIIVTNGSVTPPSPPGPPSSSTPDAAITISANVQRAFVTDIIIQCADSPIDTAGRVGIEIAGDDVQIHDCTITSGNATERAADTAGKGPSGGDGILITSTASNALVKKCIIMATGRGAHVILGGVDGLGGNGGHGIHVNGANNSKISFCTVMSTGDGGRGIGSNAGDGGDGIRIAISSVHTLVHDCVLRNIGADGQSPFSGVDGIGIRDAVVVSDDFSVIYRNIVHNVAGAARYSLQGGANTGTAVPNPPTTGTTIASDFENIYFS